MRPKYCVAVADARRARIFELVHPEPGQLGGSSRLVERADLVQPQRRARDAAVFANTRPGLRRGSGRGAPAHAVDDRRQANRDDDDRRFAADVVDEIVRTARSIGANHIVLAATHNMLSLFRGHAARLSRTGAEIAEVPRELTPLTPPKLYGYLARENFLP